jgi:hypothetical protein
MPRAKKRSRKKRPVISHAAYAKLVRSHRHSQKAIALARERGHIPTKVLETYLAKMPRHMHELAALIKRRRAAGE